MPCNTVLSEIPEKVNYSMIEGELRMAAKTLRKRPEARLAEGDISYPEVRKFLAPQYRHLPGEYIEQIIAQNFGEDVNPEDIEGFFSDIGNFVKHAGQAAVKVLPSVLPVAGTVVGTAFGGPLGGALGSTLGGALGGALKQGQAPGGAFKPAAALSGLAGGLLSGVAGKAIPGGNASAIQLLQTLTQPKVMQSIQAMALGQAGKQAIPVAGKQIPVSAFANLIGTLANQVAAEQHAFREGDGSSAYLLDSEGLPVVDPVSPEQRAAALLSLLQQESVQQKLDRSRRRTQSEPLSEADYLERQDMDHYYDLQELAMLHEDLTEWELD
jgi:hypothetical protein